MNCLVSVQYMVIPGSEQLAFYKLTDPQRQITAYIFDVVRASVPKIELDDVFSVCPLAVWLKSVPKAKGLELCYMDDL